MTKKAYVLAILFMVSVSGLISAAPAVAQTPVWGPEIFPRETAEPVTVVRSFSVPDPTLQCTIVVLTGESASQRVSSGVISINGELIIGPDEFNQNVGEIRKPIGVLEENEIAVRVTSVPGTALTVAIYCPSIDDTEPPTIVITGVTSGQCGTEDVTPVVEVGDQNLDSYGILLDWIPFTSGTAVSTEGNHLLLVIATDEAGNTAQEAVTFIIDRTPPEVTCNLSDGEIFSEDIAVLSGCWDDNESSCELQIDGRSAQQGSFVAGEGCHTIVVTCTDCAGNKTARTISVAIEEDKPTSRNLGIANSEGDLLGINMGRYVVLYWAREEQAIEYIVYRADVLSGAWQELERLPANYPNNHVDITPKALEQDLYYHIEALGVNSEVIRVYEAIRIPRFSGELPPGQEGAKTQADGEPWHAMCLSDYDFTNVYAMTLEEIEDCLEWNDSFLKGDGHPDHEKGEIFDVDGQTINPAKLIYKYAQADSSDWPDTGWDVSINPRVIIATIQKESGAIIKQRTRLDDGILKNLMGWCPECQTTGKTIRGQIERGIWQLRRDYARLRNGFTTLGGWKVGKAMPVKDRDVVVIPEKKAVAVLFQYTDYVGELWGGQTGGNAGFCDLWQNWDTYLQSKDSTYKFVRYGVPFTPLYPPRDIAGWRKYRPKVCVYVNRKPAKPAEVEFLLDGQSLGASLVDCNRCWVMCPTDTSFPNIWGESIQMELSATLRQDWADDATVTTNLQTHYNWDTVWVGTWDVAYSLENTWNWFEHILWGGHGEHVPDHYIQGSGFFDVRRVQANDPSNFISYSATFFENFRFGSEAGCQVEVIGLPGDCVTLRIHRSQGAGVVLTHGHKACPYYEFDFMPSLRSLVIKDKVEGWDTQHNQSCEMYVWVDASRVVEPRVWLYTTNPVTKYEYRPDATAEKISQVQFERIGGDDYPILSFTESIRPEPDTFTIPKYVLFTGTYARLPGEVASSAKLSASFNNSQISSTSEDSAAGDEYSLLKNYPNPFNPTTQISFSLCEAAHVKLEIYNILGQKVTTLLDDQVEAGDHRIQWDGKNAGSEPVANGIYFYRLQADGFVETKKMVLLK